jgi:hypothetical protein
MPSIKTRGTVNIAILESVSLFFSNVDDDYINTHKKSIIENFDKLIKDNLYIEAVRLSTGTKHRVLNRFRLATEILGANKR